VPKSVSRLRSSTPEGRWVGPNWPAPSGLCAGRARCAD